MLLPWPAVHHELAYDWLSHVRECVSWGSALVLLHHELTYRWLSRVLHHELACNWLSQVRECVSLEFAHQVMHGPCLQHHGQLTMYRKIVGLPGIGSFRCCITANCEG